jgi:hypothetical protein
VLSLTGLASRAAADPPVCTPNKKAALTTGALEVPELAARIDLLINAKLAAAGVNPVALADDAEFLRRVYLDLAGRIPRAMDVRDFLQDADPNKRQRLVESLLESPNYVSHFTNVWRALLLPQANNQQIQFLVGGFEGWLRERLRDNTPYDQMVRELLTTPMTSAGMPGGPRSGFDPNKPSPIAFYQASELKPENLAGATSRLFLGVKLECAQCHDHPHASWTRKQFWDYAAFFSGIQARGDGGVFVQVTEAPESRTLKIPGTDKFAQARFLDGTEPRWQDGMQSRAALAVWTTMGNNPYFARAAANRLWAHFFGLGLAEPVDDLSDQNPPSHPELLDELARQLSANRFDLKYLIRAITATQAYQRTSAVSNPNQTDPHLFARMAVRGLSGEQLFDSLVTATYFHEPEQQPLQFGQGPVNSPRAQFLAKFASQEKRTEYHTSILQALSLMNGKFIEDATSLAQSRTLAAVADSPFQNRAQRVETLYIATLSRKPRPEELTRMVKYVESGGPRNSETAALADVFWALLNSAEFMLNH